MVPWSAGSLTRGPPGSKGEGLCQEVDKCAPGLLRRLPEGQDPIAMATHHQDPFPDYFRIPQQASHLAAHGGRPVLHRRVGDGEVQSQGLLPDGRGVAMEDVPDGRVSVVQHPMSHGLGGRPYQPEALHPVALRVIARDYAKVCKGQGGKPAGLGAGDEEGARARRSLEWWKTAAQVAEAHAAVPVGVLAHQARPEKATSPGDEQVRCGAVDLWVQRGWPMVCLELDDTVLVDTESPYAITSGGSVSSPRYRYQ